MYIHIPFFQRLLQKIGLPIYGVIHIGLHSQNANDVYRDMFGLSDEHIVFIENVRPLTNLSSIITQNKLDLNTFNFLFMDSLTYFYGKMEELRYLDYIYIRSRNNADDLLCMYGYRQALSIDEHYLYKRPVNVYRFIRNDSLRLGNVIHTVIHLLYFAEETSSHIYFHFNPHSLFTGMFNGMFYPNYGIRKLEQATAKLYLVERNTSCMQVLAYQFYFNSPSLPMERERRHIARKYITPCLPSPNPSDSDCLVIHIRSGDVFSDTQHSHYIQPPTKYYEYIIRKYGYEHIRIVTEPDKQNPVIEQLCEMFPHIEIHHDELKDDVARILGAKHLVIGTGSFGYMLSLCSHHLQKLYCFQTHNVYYHHSDYEIIVLGIDETKSDKTYPKYWENDINVLTDDKWVIQEMDMSTFTEQPKNYWDEYL